jgi:predicted nucleotidyltransferase
VSRSPIAKAAAALDDAGLPFALIGATAMSVHGVPRTTRDVDLLVASPRSLDDEVWADVRGAVIRRGDDDDPLHGVVRIGSPRARMPVDVVVPRGGWLADVVARAIRDGPRVSLGGVEVPVVTLEDLVLLKADAGGYTDRQDILLVLAAWPARSDAIAAHVEAELPRTSDWTRSVWRQVWTAWLDER